MEIIKLKITNCFLIKTNSNCILIDTGYDGELKKLEQGLSTSNHSINDIDYIFLTHCHDDHAGLVAEIIKQKPRIKIIISKHGADFCKTGRHNNIEGTGYFNKRVSFILSLRSKINKNSSHTYPSFNIRETDIIIDKDCSFKDINIDLDAKIILTPGHTMDHISIILKNGYCIAGDAAANFPKILGLNYCVVSANDFDLYYKSWQKIIDEGAKTIFPSHGKPFSVELLKKNMLKNKKQNMVFFDSAYTRLKRENNTEIKTI